MNVDAIKLAVLDASNEAAVMKYRDEFLVSQSYIPGSGGLEQYGEYGDWLNKIVRDDTNPSQDRVRATQYLALDGQGHLIGMIQLRHTLNDYLLKFGGHIGYSVRPSERRKGYATQMLLLCAQEARKLGIDRVLVTCDASNVGSRGVIEKAGGILEDSIPNPATGQDTLRFWLNVP